MFRFFCCCCTCASLILSHLISFISFTTQLNSTFILISSLVVRYTMNINNRFQKSSSSSLLCSWFDGRWRQKVGWTAHLVKMWMEKPSKVKQREKHSKEWNVHEIFKINNDELKAIEVKWTNVIVHNDFQKNHIIFDFFNPLYRLHFSIFFSFENFPLKIYSNFYSPYILIC